MPIVLILISVGLFYLHISPRYAQVQSLMEQQDEYTNALAKADELKLKRDQLLTTYNNFSKDDLSRIERLVPETVNTVKLISDINSLAGQYGIVIKGITTTQQIVDNSQNIGGTAAAQKKPFHATLILFKFSSTYPNLVSYLKNLEKSLQVIDVQSVSFQVPSDDVVSGIYDYQVSIQTYSLN